MPFLNLFLISYDFFARVRNLFEFRAFQYNLVQFLIIVFRVNDYQPDPERTHLWNELSLFMNELLKTNVKDKIRVQGFDFICPSGSQPGKLYGLGKAHKPGYPFRSVVFMIGTAEYNLAQYLDKLIKPPYIIKIYVKKQWIILTRL